MAVREARRPSTLPAHNREHTAMAAHNHGALLLVPMNVQRSSAGSSMMSKSRNIRWLKRFAAVEARSSLHAHVSIQDVGKDGGDHTALRPLDGPRRTRFDHRLPRRRFARGAAGLGHLKAHSSPIVNRQAKAAVRCPRVRADRSPADRAAVPPASAPLRRKRAVAHDVEAQCSTVVTPALGAGHPVDRVHRSRVPGGTRGFRPRSRR